MKKLISICLLLCVAAIFCGCTKTTLRGDFGGTPTSLMPYYIGGALTNDPDHTFTKDEFKVMMIFSDSSMREITDYKLRQERSEGCYEIFVTWGDLEGYRIIPVSYDPATDPALQKDAETEETQATEDTAEETDADEAAAEEPAA